MIFFEHIKLDKIISSLLKLCALSKICVNMDSFEWWDIIQQKTRAINSQQNIWHGFLYSNLILIPDGGVDLLNKEHKLQYLLSWIQSSSWTLNSYLSLKSRNKFQLLSFRALIFRGLLN